MADILEAVPIDKYFELFKPGAGGDGGFIRIGMNYEDAASRPMEVITGESCVCILSASVQVLYVIWFQTSPAWHMWHSPRAVG